VAIVSVLVIVIGGALLFGRGGPGHHPAAVAKSSTAPPKSAAPSGRTQAALIASFLAESGQMRKSITTAITSIEGCTDNAASVTALQNAATTRTKIVQDLSKADVSALRAARRSRPT